VGYGDYIGSYRFQLDSQCNSCLAHRRVYYTAFKISVRHTPLEKMPVEVQIRRVFGKEAKMALAISQAENGTRECAREVNEPNGTKSYGVFMVNDVHVPHKATVKELKTCLGNIKVAYQIYIQQGGFTAWSVYKNNSYKRFLN
jgi:hypothetical protein